MVYVARRSSMRDNPRVFFGGIFLMMAGALYWATSPTAISSSGTVQLRSDSSVDDLGLGNFESDYPRYPKNLLSQAELSPDTITNPESAEVQVQDAAKVVVEDENSEPAFAEEDEDGNIILDEPESFEERVLEDYEAYSKAPEIASLPESKGLKYRMIVLQHERYYRTHPSKLYVPRIKKTARITKDDFYRHFLFKSQPVIVPFEAMRHVNFTMKSYTLPELMELYPNHKPMIYKYGAVQTNRDLDLGPAVATLFQNKKLQKNAKGRNFPRNTKINLRSLAKIGLQDPPYILPRTSLLPGSLWFGTTADATRFHSDCCDNYAMMISGTKRWTVAPPNDARLLKPKCTGGLCWVNSLEHPDEHAATKAQIKIRDAAQLVTFDLRPGDMLYLPTGWFHHVENVGPTIMVNFWTHGGAAFLRNIDGEFPATGSIST